MKEITLDNLTDDQLRSESMTLIDMIRSKYPRLDLRRGTVLRDLLIDADAAVGAWFSAQAVEQRESSSLLALSERAAAGEEVDRDDVNAILSNFNMESVSGTKSRGYVRIVVNSGDFKHTVVAGTQFRTVDGVSFLSTMDVTAATDPSYSNGETRQYPTGTGTFWYLVPVEASEPGSAGNLGQGTAVDPRSALSDFVSASAYETFSGGSDLEGIDQTIGRIKSSLSTRNLTTPTAVEARLRDRYDSGDNPIVAVSVCGYGNPAQRRDKHNLFGTAVGGRADIYVRNFTDLPVADNPNARGTVVEREYGQNDTRDFSIFIPHSKVEDGNTPVPGGIFVYSVSDPDSNALSSYPFDVKYSGDVSGNWHDFDVHDDVHELANTVWRDFTIIVKGVPVSEDDIKSGEREFRVTFVSLPAASSLQDFVDDGLVRNVAADYVVRGPMIVNVSVNAVVRYRQSTGFDKDRAVRDICGYVNTTGFPGRLTRSEISSILMDLGAASVDLFDESEMLYGYVYDAYGKKHELTGDALDVDLVETYDGMLTADTAVFVVEPKNVHIRAMAV